MKRYIVPKSSAHDIKELSLSFWVMRRPESNALVGIHACCIVKMQAKR
jgi:hypothetical protein